ncbi:MAG: group III truncated hemoglobin [Bacteroidetes bacterium]|jgi:hemoglobin|nr:group III truncated hemoglobin [Bacteroidota bacterium]
MKEIESKEDIRFLVDTFYSKVVKSEIGFFFDDIAKINWAKHLPNMYDFWSTLLFGEVAYKGNPMAVHFPINEIVAMEKHHFDIWIKLWTTTVNENFEGEIANLAIYKANNIAQLMAYKMEMARRM